MVRVQTSLNQCTYTILLICISLSQCRDVLCESGRVSKVNVVVDYVTVDTMVPQRNRRYSMFSAFILFYYYLFVVSNIQLDV